MDKLIGKYSNGRTALICEVEVKIANAHLILISQNKIQESWDLNHISFEKITKDQISIKYLDSEIVASLSAWEKFKKNNDSFINCSINENLSVHLPYYLIGILIALFTCYYSIGTCSSFIADQIPYSFEEKLMESTWEEFKNESYDDPEVLAVVNHMFEELGERPELFKIFIVDDPIVNAIAMPAKTIVLYRGLINQAESPEEIIGIIAHELGHIYHNHILQNLVKSMFVTFLVYAVSDFFGGGGIALNPTELITKIFNSRYSVISEKEADAYAFNLLEKNKISTQGIINFFNRVNKSKASKFDDFLSTHPKTNDRIKFFSPGVLTHFQLSHSISRQEWKLLKSICN